MLRIFNYNLYYYIEIYFKKSLKPLYFNIYLKFETSNYMPKKLKWLKIDSRASFLEPFFSIFKNLIKLLIFYNFTIKLTNYIKIY